MKKNFICFLSLMILCVAITACGENSNADNLLVSTNKGSSTISISKDKGLDVSNIDVGFTVQSPSGPEFFVRDGEYEALESGLFTMDYVQTSGKLYDKYDPQFSIRYDETDSIYCLTFDADNWKLENGGLGTNSKYDSSIGATEKGNYDGSNYRDWYVFYDAKGKMITNYNSVKVNKKLIEDSGGFVYAYSRGDDDDEDVDTGYALYLYTTNKETMKNWIKGLGISDEDVGL